MLGSFPASLQVSPDGEWAYVVNFNLHGDMVPSSVSIVATGEMVGVIGPNGAGKTTLFNIISGVTLPTSGRVLLQGDDSPGALRDQRRLLQGGRRRGHGWRRWF